MDIAQLANQQEAYIIEKRRDFHQHPELSWEETRTTRVIADELTAMGIAPRLFAEKPGLVGTLRGSKPGAGKTVVLRADIDALPILEQTGLPFCSLQPGIMHACGHDCHTAMLLGAARILSSLRDQFAGEVRFLFQGAEEINDGAGYCIAQGALDGADAVCGMHIWGDFDAPYFNIAEGSRMASCDNFTITVHGVSAHGSAPQQGVDAIVAAAAIVTQLQTLVSRGNDPRIPLVITVGEIHGGKRFNILADKVELVGTVRTHDRAVRAQVEGNLRRMVECTAAAHGATASVDYQYLSEPIINDHPALTRLAQNAVTRLYGEDALKSLPPMMCSEDFSAYQTKAPSVFCFLGGRNTALGFVAANHNDHFTVDETVLKRGAALYAQFAFDFLTADAT